MLTYGDIQVCPICRRIANIALPVTLVASATAPSSLAASEPPCRAHGVARDSGEQEQVWMDLFRYE